MSSSNDVSQHVVQRLRAFRLTRRMTADQFARGITLNGYHMTRVNFSNLENGHRSTIPVDLAVAAAKFLKIGLDELLDGPLCRTCQDNPPVQFICRTCLRTKNAAGNVISAREDVR